MQIKIDDLANGEVIALLEEHLSDMYATSPPESVHALDVEALKAPEITFFSAWHEGQLAGCVAIKILSDAEVELKSMRTVKAFRGKGVASQLLLFALEHAKIKGFRSVSLETGTQDYFTAARKLYQKFHFIDCGPFSHYTLDPNSHFMTRTL
ncbi:GNAT family N-acetyltransferase [Alteromonas sp. D210916BOD_24]|uniref:GNAT family N-acetyltransferase n=1 Tax=Alteromonas sp. D210916BOD_24 TaxID=3157618 RepID=UPI00399D519D